MRCFGVNFKITCIFWSLLQNIADIEIFTIAGIIQNRKTGEVLELILDRDAREVEVISTGLNVTNKIIALSAIKQKKSDVNLWVGTNWVFLEDSYTTFGGPALLIPPMTPIAVGAVVYDVLALPVKGLVKAIQNDKYKKDLQILMVALVSTDIKLVSSKRFRRIEALLK